jgi:hypothetical protein
MAAGGRPARGGPALLAATAALLIGACQVTTSESCTEHHRPIGLDDANATGMTVREIGARYHVADAWSCPLTWAALGSQTNATWSPHDATTTVSLGLRWGPGGATEITQTTPAGDRGYCPASVTVDLILDVATDDGGLADSWPATGRYVFGVDNFDMYVDANAAGGFHGGYAFALAQPGDWSQRLTTVSVSMDESFLNGSLREDARRSTGANQGEGIGVNTATWTCTMPQP